MYKDVMKHGKKVTDRKLAGKHVVVIGGGDTGNDCIGSAIRQGATSVKQLEITRSYLLSVQQIILGRSIQ